MFFPESILQLANLIFTTTVFKIGRTMYIYDKDNTFMMKLSLMMVHRSWLKPMDRVLNRVLVAPQNGNKPPPEKDLQFPPLRNDTT